MNSNLLSTSFIAVWKKEFANKDFRTLFIITVVALVITLTLLTNFLTFNETRDGFAFKDPILSLFKP
ncbi:MAG: hypothetical protein KAQ90_04605, partial [Melioribacteraceae bacterium]|nr:hypothetical protein [Melioribacteraceae bacterium]